MDKKRMIEERDVKNFLYGVMRWFKGCFEECEVIEEALYFRRIPESFWKDERRGGSGIMGYDRPGKKDIRKIRKELVDALIENIQQDGFEVDNYERCLRALRIFHVPATKIPGARDNHKYNLAYHLYTLIDERDPAKRAETVSLIGWIAAEISK